MLEVAAAVGRVLTVAQAERLGRELRMTPGPADARGLGHLVPSPAFMDAVSTLVSAWNADPGVDGALLGGAVAGAAHSADQARREEAIETVVSGPRSSSLHPRSTEQVLLELIAEAQSEVLLITYALQGYDDLRKAIGRAIERGVAVTVLAEDADDAPQFAGDPARALFGLAVRRLRWPRSVRPARGAAMHAKVVVIDRRTILITSANLTQRASADNMEIGLVLRGGEMGRRVAGHVDDLEKNGVLLPVMD